MDYLVPIALAINFVIIAILMLIYFTRIRHAGPNEALIVFGRGPHKAETGGPGFRFVISGRTFIWPVVERAVTLSLEPARAETTLRDLSMSDGTRQQISAVVQYKVGRSEKYIAQAASHLLSKSETDKNRLVTDVVEEEVRSMIASDEWRQSTTAQMQEMVLKGITPRLAELGLEVVSLILK